MSEQRTAADTPGTPAASEWPLRPWLLAGLLGLAGLLVDLLTGGNFEQSAARTAAAAFIAFGAIAAAFTVERDRWKEPLAFAVLAGLVMAGLAWRAAAAGDQYADPEYGFAAGLLATALALPLFQARFHRRRFATPYPEFHELVWTDAISAGGSLAFTGISWIVLVIISELFGLLKIDFLKDLMREEWFDWTYSGLAFGAALGTIRNEQRLLGTLRMIVVLVLSLLALPVAVALVLFLLSMAVSGPQVLWQATRSATPVLLACAAGAFVLANTILRADDAEMPKGRALRIAALALALTILPLTGFAAVSMGTRISQHGLSPERLWAIVAIAIAFAYALAYAAAVVRGYQGSWRERLRSTNLALAAGVCAIAFVLSLPILDFGAISANNQVKRLQSGKVAPEKFDFEALRWDFGAAGRRALARLAKNPNGTVAELARNALAETRRVYAGFDQTRKTRADFRLRVQPDDPALGKQVLDYLVTNPWQCDARCVALDLGPAGNGRRVAIVQGTAYQVIIVGPGRAPVQEPQTVAPAVPLQDNSTVEIREVPTRFIFIDGKPLPQPLHDHGTRLEASPAPR
jgi:hypothetical protein